MKRITGRTENGIAYIRSETGEEGVGAFTTQRRLPELIQMVASIEDILGDEYDFQELLKFIKQYEEKQGSGEAHDRKNV